MRKKSVQRKDNWRVVAKGFCLTYTIDENPTESQVMSDVELLLDAFKHHCDRNDWDAALWMVGSHINPRAFTKPWKYALEVKIHIHSWLVACPGQTAFNWIKNYWEERHGFCRPCGQIKKPGKYSQYLKIQSYHQWFRKMGKYNLEKLGDAGLTLRAARQNSSKELMQNSSLEQTPILNSYEDSAIRLGDTMDSNFNTILGQDGAALSTNDNTLKAIGNACLSLDLKISNAYPINSDLGDSPKHYDMAHNSIECEIGADYSYTDAPYPDDLSFEGWDDVCEMSEAVACGFADEILSGIHCCDGEYKAVSLAGDDLFASLPDALPCQGKASITPWTRFHKSPLQKIRPLKNKDTRIWVIWHLQTTRSGPPTKLFRNVPTFELELSQMRTKQHSRNIILDIMRGYKMPSKLFPVIKGRNTSQCTVDLLFKDELFDLACTRGPNYELDWGW